MCRVSVYFLLSLMSLSVFAEESITRQLDIEFESEIYASKSESHVTQGQMDAYMQRVPERDRAGVLSSPERIGKMVDQMLLQQRIVDDSDLEELLSDDTLSAHIYQAATSLIAEERVRQVVREAELDSYVDRGRELYLADPEQFRSPPTADFTHVIIATNDKTDREAIRIIDQFMAELDEGVSFDKLVKEYSDDPSVSDNGGSFEGMAKGDLDKRFADVLFELEASEISDPVRTPYGWHVVRLDAMHEGEIPEYEQVKQQATDAARQQHLDRVRNEYYEEMNAGEITIREGATESLLERYGAAGESTEE